ncbi:MAG: hypothetical protein KDK65_02465 [Chlamydiia bacterium]|nr:hypothetical protein [Chlamydiia bacterium]
MYKALVPILDIQELDMQMLQLMRLKKTRQLELKDLTAKEESLRKQAVIKEGEIIELKKNIRMVEGQLEEVKERLKKLEAQQNAVKKVDEFNALTHEMAQVEKERNNKENRLSDLYDKLADEEDTLKALQEALKEAEKGNEAVKEEISANVSQLNSEGRKILSEREQKVETADPDVFAIYQRLLQNKRDRVVVPLENRCCSGCHILLTPQDENLVRKGERLAFCEHCSRIHYWQESEVLEGTSVATTKKRRRRSTVSSKS